MTAELSTFFKVVIVGHVDHGKSTLIGRLLHDTGTIPADKIATIRHACAEAGQPFEFAYITDQIREERAQGITLDTTQIPFTTRQRDYVIIDAPGHKELLKNMITGASQAEGAMLVIDAAEGVQEQTRRHACLLNFLGLRQPIIVVNKMDLVGYNEETYLAICREMAAFLHTLGQTMSPPIPIAAATGDNIATASVHLSWYTGPLLLDALDALPKRPALTELPFRMPVQDVYQIHGARMIVGQIEAGRVTTGDRLRLLPGAGTVTVTGVHEFGRDRHSAECGENIGLTVAETADIRRGQMLSACASLPSTTDTVLGTICWLAPEPLSRGESLIFRGNTQEIPCRISHIQQRMDSSSLAFSEEDAACLYETEIGTVRIVTAEPVLIESFAVYPSLGRFVLERNGAIVAGGVVSC